MMTTTSTLMKKTGSISWQKDWYWQGAPKYLGTSICLEGVEENLEASSCSKHSPANIAPPNLQYPSPKSSSGFCARSQRSTHNQGQQAWHAIYGHAHFAFLQILAHSRLQSWQTSLGVKLQKKKVIGLLLKTWFRAKRWRVLLQMGYARKRSRD